MLRYLLVVPAIVLLGVGGEGLYHLVRSRHQVTLGCAEFVRSPPGSLHVRIDGCEIDTAAATYRVSGGRLRELYFPARLPGTPTTRPVPILVATSDREALRHAQPAVDAGARGSREQSRGAMARAIEAAGGPVISGTVRAGILHRLLPAADVARLGTPLAPDAVVIDQGRAPGLLWPATAFAAGLGLLILAVVRRQPRRVPEAQVARSAEAVAVRERLLTYTSPPTISHVPEPTKATAAPRAESAALVKVQKPAATSPAEIPRAPAAPETPPPTSAPLSPEPAPSPPAAAAQPELPARRTASVRVRRHAVMLLNLDPAAPREAIETAAPIGRREEVASRLRATIPSLETTGTGLLVAPPADPHLICDLGRGDIVHTVVVQLRDEEGAELLADLIARTGWRAFVPRLGRFVGPQDLDSLRDPAGQGELIS